ncbi:MAG: glutamate--cysteine ligase [Deltaproteobacteria bacterium]|nr:glutamate--cysteine ligase [Deltaproteobacteria bacterium]
MDKPLTRTDMLRWFESGFSPPEQWRMGLEWEKELVHAEGRRITYFEPGGIRDVLQGFTQFGWKGSFEGPHLVAMARDDATLTIEPGGQLEISTAPRHTVSEIEGDVRTHLRELQQVLRGTDVMPLALGYTPIQPVASIPFVPKGRYSIMSEYLAAKGPLAHGMMKGTSSVQVTIDVTNHADAGRKVPVAFALSPLVLAMFANSPIAEGRDTGWASWRAHCWQHTDPARTGLMADVFGHGFSFERYVDWLLEVPMFFYREGESYKPAHGRPFGDFVARGHNGRFPTLDDFALHVNTVFPEVRVGKWLEMRSADNVPLEMIPSLAAFWKGIMYDPQALADAEELTRAIPMADRAQMHATAARDGLSGRYKKRRLRSWAALALEISVAGLRRQAPDGPAEVAYLAPLRDLLAQGESPAIASWKAFEGGGDWLRSISYPPVDSVPAVDPAHG